MYTEQQLLDAIRDCAVGCLPKWPQMVVTGKPVTVDQAKEIIFRTDRFMTDACEYSGGNARDFNAAYRTRAGLDKLMEERKYPEGHTYMSTNWELQEKLNEAAGILQLGYVNNSWASSAFIFGPHGWCHPDGTISYIDNVGKWPSVDEVYADWVAIAQAFPFLDINVTLMSGESCEEDETYPVINFRVVDGDVTIEAPDTSVHNGAKAADRDINEAVMWISRPGGELGLPMAWYDEYADRVSALVDSLTGHESN